MKTKLLTTAALISVVLISGCFQPSEKCGDDACNIIIPPKTGGDSKMSFGFGIEYAAPRSVSKKMGVDDPAKLYAETGANWVKFSLVSWNIIEPTSPVNGIHNYNWSLLDDLILNHQQTGFKIAMVLKCDARWAVYPTGQASLQPATPPKNEEYWGYYADWISALVGRYDMDGKDDMPGLLYPVTDFEIESEAQHDGFWRVPAGKDRFTEYARLLRTAYEAAHKANPDARIILSGINLGDVFDDGRNLTDEKIVKVFKEKVGDLPGAMGYALSSFDFIKKSLALEDSFDVVEFHYNMNYLGGYGTMNWIKSKMAENGYSKPIWAGDALIATPAETNPFFVYHPFPKLGDKLLLALHEQNNSYNKKAWDWYLADQSSNLIKKIIVALDTGMEGIMAGNTGDWPDWFTMPNQRYWTYGGFYGQDDPSAPLPGSVKGKRPVFYNYWLVVDKIGQDAQDVKRLDTDNSIFVYRIIKSDNSTVYVAWHEDQIAKKAMREVTSLEEFFETADFTKKTIFDLSPHVPAADVKVTHIIAKQGKTSATIEIVPSSAVPVGETPIFIEEHVNGTPDRIDFGVDTGTPAVYAYYTGRGRQFMPHIRDLGIKVSRVSILWGKIEPKPPVNGAHDYDWQIVDALLNQLQEGDVMLLTVATSSPWATEEYIQGSAVGSPIKNDAECRSSYGMTCHQAYDDFIRNLALRTEGRIGYWNRDTEPGTKRHWPAEKYAEYVEVQKTFYNAIKSVQPGAIIIGGGHVGVFNAKGEPSQKDFFDYFLKNAEDYFDMFDVRLYWDKYSASSSIGHRVNWFKNRMREFGYQKPIATTEYGGPTPQEFPEEFDFVEKWCVDNDHITDRDSWDELYSCVDAMKPKGVMPPQIKMFLDNAPAELDAKRDRIQCRDNVQRTVLIAAEEVRYLSLWNLFEPNTVQGGPVNPIFGKMRLMDMENDSKRKAYYCYQTMASKLKEMVKTERIDAGDADIYFYRITKQDGSDIFVAWKKPADMFCTEPDDLTNYPAECPTIEQPASLNYNVSFSEVRITDVFGSERANGTNNGRLTLEITDTPVFIELHNTTASAEQQSRLGTDQVILLSDTFRNTRLEFFDPQGYKLNKGGRWVEDCKRYCNADCTQREIYCDFSGKSELEEYVEEKTPEAYREFENPLATIHVGDYATGDGIKAKYPDGHEKEYLDFVEVLVSEYGISNGGKIKYWEIQNEVDVGEFWDDTMEGYSRLVNIAATKIREVCPECKVGISLGSLYSPNKAIWPLTISCRSFDFVDAHLYPSLWNQTKEYGAHINNWADWLNAQGCGEKEFVSTETGIFGHMPAKKTPEVGGSEAKQAQDAIKVSVIALDAGYSRIHWYACDVGPGNLWGERWDNVGMLEEDCATKKEEYYSLKNLAENVDYFESISKIAEGQYRFSFANKTPVYALWCKSRACDIPSEITGRIRVTDYQGTKRVTDAADINLDESPIFVETV